MLTSNVGIVSQTTRVTFEQLGPAVAALQRQVARDFGPIWGMQATVDGFPTLDDVPVGYWQIIIMDDIPFHAAGIHLNERSGQPFALVRYSEEWTLTTSHECLEMLADPNGNRLVPGDSAKPDQGRVEYLVEVCDPSESATYAYSVNGFLVSDFYTPQFFDPKESSGVRYSFTGAITRPRQVLDGGYISWREPISGHLWQLFVDDGQETFVDQGEIPLGVRSLRALSDRKTAEHRYKAAARPWPAKVTLLSAAGGHRIRNPMKNNAALLRSQIEALVKPKKP
jgi:hypothetical protein